MGTGIRNKSFHVGQVYRGTINGEIFTVEAVREEPRLPRRGAVTAVYFRHQRSGKRFRKELATAQRLLLEEVRG